MALNKDQVYIGGPDQSVTGAIAVAPLGTALPTSVGATLDPAFDDSGYINKDGLTLKTEQSTTTIQDWNLDPVREVFESFNGTLTYSHLQTNKMALGDYFGAANVTETAANATHGTQQTVTIRPNESPRASRVFKIKDGSRRVLIVLDECTVKSNGEVKFLKSDAIQWPVTVTAYPNASGVYGHIYFDDGQTIAI